MSRTCIAFTKAEANGNDFLLVEASALPSSDWPAFTRAICERHRGVGADGVEFYRCNGGEIVLTLLNADGSEAEISGNGTRCVAAFATERFGQKEASIRTAAGVRQARILRPARGSEPQWIEIDMGAPRFQPDAIPIEIAGATAAAPLCELPIEAAGRSWKVTALSMGNPQCVLLLPEFPADWERVGAAIESHPAFPRKTNVEFVRILNRHRIEVRIFERGVGPTESSGTGSCAAAVAAILAGAAQSPVQVLTPGGEQEVEWSGGAAPVRLRGPACLVATGEYRWTGE